MDAMLANPVTKFASASPSKMGRPRTDYRAARRNAAKAARMLPEWRASVSDAANERANIAGRAIMANGAREAAAKALVDVRTSGLPRHTLAATAMLAFYHEQKQTRVVSRIIRELERQVAGK